MRACTVGKWVLVPQFWANDSGLGNYAVWVLRRIGNETLPEMIRKVVVLNHEEDSFQPKRIQRRASLFFPGFSTHLAADASPAYHGAMPKD
jgi:hypothetical protein